MVKLGVRLERLLLLLVEVEVERGVPYTMGWQCRVQKNKQWVSKWDSEVSTEKEIKIKSAATSYIYRGYDQVKVEMQIRELNEKDARRCMLHDLRMTRQYTVG